MIKTYQIKVLNKFFLQNEGQYHLDGEAAKNLHYLLKIWINKNIYLVKI